MDRIAWIKERIKITESGCWEWQGSKDKNGYGMTTTSEQGKIEYHRVHRWIWQLHNGPIPKGKMICHHCDNPVCVNIDHLYQGDATTNRRDCVCRKRTDSQSGDEHWTARRPENIPRGSVRGHAKLNEDKVREIRRKKECRTCSVRDLLKQLAKEYGVSPGTIAHVIWRKKWKHVV